MGDKYDLVRITISNNNPDIRSEIEKRLPEHHQLNGKKPESTPVELSYLFEPPLNEEEKLEIEQSLNEFIRSQSGRDYGIKELTLIFRGWVP